MQSNHANTRNKGEGLVMKKVLALLLVVAAVAATAIAATATAAPASKKDVSLSGAGSSFVFPLVSKWIPALGSAYGYNVSYSPIGSGGGIAAITAKTVDFGASDAPLSNDQQSACPNCVQIPWALSATSIMYNLPNIGCVLRLTGPVLASIYLGQTTTWNDASITKINPKCNLTEHEDHAGPPVGQLRDDVQLHRLPVGRQPCLEVEARCRRQRAVAGWRGSER